MSSYTKYSGYQNFSQKELVQPKINTHNLYKRDFFKEMAESPRRKVLMYENASRWVSNYNKDYVHHISPENSPSIKKEKDIEINKEKILDQSYNKLAKYTSSYQSVNNDLCKSIDILRQKNKYIDLSSSPSINKFKDLKREDRHVKYDSEYREVYSKFEDPREKFYIYNNNLSNAKIGAKSIKKLYLDNFDISKGTPRGADYNIKFSGYVPRDISLEMINYQNSPYQKANKLDILNTIKNSSLKSK
jgi:hypothetical protein